MVFEMISDGLGSLSKQVTEPVSSVSDKVKKGMSLGPRTDIDVRSRDLAFQLLFVEALGEYITKYKDVAATLQSIVEFRAASDVLDTRYKYINTRINELKKLLDKGVMTTLTTEGTRSDKTKKVSKTAGQKLLLQLGSFQASCKELYKRLVKYPYHLYVVPLESNYNAKNERNVYRKLFRESIDNQINHEYDVTTSQKAVALDMYELKQKAKDKKPSTHTKKRITKIIKELLPKHMQDLQTELTQLAKDEKSSISAWELYREHYQAWEKQCAQWLDANSAATQTALKSHTTALNAQDKMLVSSNTQIKKLIKELSGVTGAELAVSLLLIKDTLSQQELDMLDRHGMVSQKYLHFHKNLGIQHRIVTNHQMHLIEELSLLKDRSITRKLISRLKSKHVYRGKKAWSLAIDAKSAGIKGTASINKQLETYLKEFESQVASNKTYIEENKKLQQERKTEMKELNKALDMIALAHRWLEIHEQVAHIESELGSLANEKELSVLMRDTYKQLVEDNTNTQKKLQVQVQDIQQSLAMTKGKKLQSKYDNLLEELHATERANDLLGQEYDAVLHRLEDIDYLEKVYNDRLKHANKDLKHYGDKLHKWNLTIKKFTHLSIDTLIQPKSFT